jgi:hypothetical protein
MSAVTQWFEPYQKPTHVGIYNASFTRDPTIFRYWNGFCWSWGWGLGDSRQHTNLSKRTLARKNMDIYWRGLAVNPQEGEAE